MSLAFLSGSLRACGLRLERLRLVERLGGRFERFLHRDVRLVFCHGRRLVRHAAGPRRHLPPAAHAAAAHAARHSLGIGDSNLQPAESDRGD
jgi:hypothetical protein